MGNSFGCNTTATTGVGFTVAHSHCVESFGFDRTLRALVLLEGIEPWSTNDLVKKNLSGQRHLARTSPLRFVPVAEGLAMFKAEASHLDGRVCRWGFLRAARAALRMQRLTGYGGFADEAILSEVFDSLDIDGTADGRLSKGEWAVGLSVFFGGSHEEKVKAVFQLLDRSGSGVLERAELEEYLLPFVKALTPQSAAALRPLLLRKATDDLFREIDVTRDGGISGSEMLRWMEAGNDIVERLSTLIEHQVYQIWLEYHFVPRSLETGNSMGNLFQRICTLAELEAYGPSKAMTPSMKGNGCAAAVAEPQDTMVDLALRQADKVMSTMSRMHGF